MNRCHRPQPVAPRTVARHHSPAKGEGAAPFRRMGPVGSPQPQQLPRRPWPQKRWAGWRAPPRLLGRVKRIRKATWAAPR
jgi:hypothetical protein